MSTMSHYRPSKRPSVKDVQEWRSVYSEYNDRHWRGDSFNGQMEVFRGHPFPDFYKVVFVPEDRNKKKISKLFYGESAHHDVYRFVSDLGFQSVYNSDLW